MKSYYISELPLRSQLPIRATRSFDARGSIAGSLRCTIPLASALDICSPFV